MNVHVVVLCHFSALIVELERSVDDRSNRVMAQKDSIDEIREPGKFLALIDMSEDMGT